MRLRSNIALAGIIALTIGCAGEDATTESAAPEETAETMETSAPVDPSVPATLTEGFSTPESVLYDSDQDVYFVSNINGTPLDVDDNGYISRIDATERTMTEKWVDGTADGVDLSAPKGMAILGDELWVSDIDHIRRFDRSSGAALGSIAIEGSTFLNDLATGDGAVYVSDSGLNAQFQSSGTDQVYRVTREGNVEKLATDPSSLKGPNGLVVIDGSVWVVTFSGNELFRLADGQKTDVVTLPAGGLDGLIETPDGNVLVSSWDGKAVYHGAVSGPFEPVAEEITSPADLGFDSKRNLILIPVFQEDRIEIRPLVTTAPAETAS